MFLICYCAVMPLTGDKKREYQRQWIAKRRQDWIASRGGMCEQCGSTNRLEVDHRSSKLKQANPTQIWSKTAAKREAELALCQVLCHDCHKIKTSKQKKLPVTHGTMQGYKRGCREDCCRSANRIRVQRQRGKTSEKNESARNVSKITRMWRSVKFKALRKKKQALD